MLPRQPRAQPLAAFPLGSPGSLIPLTRFFPSPRHSGLSHSVHKARRQKGRAATAARSGGQGGWDGQESPAQPLSPVPGFPFLSVFEIQPTCFVHVPTGSACSIPPTQGGQAGFNCLLNTLTFPLSFCPKQLSVCPVSDKTDAIRRFSLQEGVHRINTKAELSLEGVCALGTGCPGYLACFAADPEVSQSHRAT